MPIGEKQILFSKMRAMDKNKVRLETADLLDVEREVIMERNDRLQREIKELAGKIWTKDEMQKRSILK